MTTNFISSLQWYNTGLIPKGENLQHLWFLFCHLCILFLLHSVLGFSICCHTGQMGKGQVRTGEDKGQVRTGRDKGQVRTGEEQRTG